MRNEFNLSESSALLVDFMNSFYLNNEPDMFLVRSIKNGELAENVLFLQETCDYDLRTCAKSNQTPADYWTNVFSVLQFCVLAATVLLKEDDLACKEAAWMIIAAALKSIKVSMVKSFSANNFEKGFLNELKGDLEIQAGEIRRAIDSYTVALGNYEMLATEDQEDYILHPEVETMFLQCDYIWKEKLSGYFVDSYDFVKGFSKRVQAKTQMAAGTYKITNHVTL
ncbi:MAG: hypothetical protein HY800_04205 [Ignavibacteriales bacterium]|nr:hypothetical protein [Ignavibacteriales bacterium]